MHVFLAGATGVLGRRIVSQLVARGHAVTGIARGAEKAGMLRGLGATAVEADLFDVEAVARVASGAEAVIHAATAIPVSGMRSARAWDANDRIRRDGTRALAAAAGRVGARVYLQQSVVWIRRGDDGRPYDESSPPAPSPLLQSAVDGEAIARRAGEERDFAVGVLRCGSFYAADAAHSRWMARELARRRLPIVGSGSTIFAPIHADDAAAAFVAGVEAGRAGTWHVVDDAPLPIGEFLRTFAAAVGAPPPRRVPAWLARLVAGRAAVDAATTSMRTTNRRAREELGWTPRFPTASDGLAEVVGRWRAEGFLPAEANPR